MGKGKRVVVLLADSVRNYMSKFLNDGWMETYGFASDIYKPVKELDELKRFSSELRNLSCADSWIGQAKLEPENQRDLEKQRLSFGVLG